MRPTTIRLAIVGLVLLSLTVPAGFASDVDRTAAKKAAIDEMSVDAVERLFEESPKTQELFAQASAYAVFDNFKFTFLLSGGGGVGVAVDRTTGDRTYMKMGSGGVGIGLGGQSYQVIILFEELEAFSRFVNKGWQADLSANAVAGTSGKNAPATFANGIAVFQLTNKGLMAQADISGTKYWKSKKLNR